MAMLRLLVVVLAFSTLEMGALAAGLRPGSSQPSVAPPPAVEAGELTSLPALRDGVVAEVLVEVGSRVKKGELLARLDPRLAEMERDLEIAKLDAARVDVATATKTCAEAKRRYDVYLSFRDRCGSFEELRGTELTYLRYKSELACKQQAVKLAELEYKRSRFILELSEVRAPADGVVRKLLKRNGAAVKAWETVILLEPD
jgi:multidrug resistance efflux pump